MQRAHRKDTRPDEYLTGVPNRSLDEEEYQALTPELRQAVRESGLWDVKTDKEVQEASKPTKVESKGGED